MPVFEALRAWRAATAKEQGVPAYVVFHDATLREIATRLPATIEELGTISGVGEAKRAKYAEGILETLAETGGAPEPASAPSEAAPPEPAAPHADEEPPFDFDETDPPWDDWQ